VTRDKSFSSVLFPAPFFPMMPTTSPCSTLNAGGHQPQPVLLADVVKFNGFHVFN